MYAEEDGDSSSSSGDACDSAKERLHEQVFNELMHEVKHGPPGARLSARLRTALERMSPSERRAVASRTREGCAPLFEAARRGNAELIEYLVHVCCAPLEQRGLYVAREERGAHRVTALWAAAVAGHLCAVRALADAGAELDARSDSGSTALRSACFMTHVAVVRELCERGADLHRPNHHGGTCLINSVQSPRLCRYLLERGAAVDARDSQGKSVLHYAVQEHRADTVRLLLAAGASPHLASRHGDDALRTAALKGAAPVLALLAERVRYSPRRLADAYELLGATQLDELNDAEAALESWRHATRLRLAAGEDRYVPKRPTRAASAALRGATEWRSLRDLDAMAHDPDALRTQAILVAVRVLGPLHKDTIFRIMYRGAAYADALRYRRCAELWTWALRLRIRRDTVLCADTSHTLCALTRLLLDARLSALGALRVLARALPRAARLVALRPRCAAQADAWDRALRAAAHLALACAAPEREAARAALRPLVRLRAAATGDTLLHLACSRLNVVRSTYFADEGAPPAAFPSLAAVRLLLDSGADVRARNDALSTPLHLAAIPYNFSTELVETLVGAGAHLDTPNKFGDSAAELVPLCAGSRVRVLAHTSLACLAARALLRAGLAPPPRALPASLRAFLDLHSAI